MFRIKLVPILALVLALAAIGTTILLQNRSIADRDAEVDLAKVETELARLQQAPLRAHDSTGGSPATARGLLSSGKRRVNRTLSELRRGSPPPTLSLVSGPLRTNYATLDKIFVIGVSSGYGQKADTLAKAAAQSNERISGLLGTARAAYHERAARSHAQATAGSVGAILLLLCAFGFFFRRSERFAHLNDRVLAASREEALTDALTGLGNRRALLNDLNSRLPREALDKKLLFALFDLDGFKQYNDTFGHPAGDALLARFAERLSATVEGTGTAYRMGGDEFCLLAQVDGNEEEIVMDATIALSDAGGAFEISCSYGSVLMPTETSVATEALRLADQRMYGRKAAYASASRQSTDVLLQVLSERGDRLAEHVGDVASLAGRTAERLGLSEEEIERTRLAAELHDIGKSAIPNAVLDKPGKLDAGEWEFIRAHTLIGERIVVAAPSLAHTADLVRSSHERLDGSGYPDGLSGDQIPIGARIIAVCDAYDEMTTDRPYHAATPSADALAEIRRCSGTQFDPAAVRAFCALVTEGDLTPAMAV